MGISFLAALPGFVWRYFSSSAVFHVVNASPSYADPVRGRPSSSAVLSREVNMLTIATAALLVLATTAEDAAIQYNPESRDTHVSDGPSFEHKRGFYYTDLHGKKIKDVSSWAPSWSSYRDAHPAEPSHSREPSMMSKPAYKEVHADEEAQAIVHAPSQVPQVCGIEPVAAKEVQNVSGGPVQAHAVGRRSEKEEEE